MNLEGKSQKGKNIVRIHGDEWTLIRTGNPVCLDGDLGHFIRSRQTRNLRWIRDFGDTDFSIV